MPDITVASDVKVNFYNTMSPKPGPVIVSALIGYLFYVTNGGAPFSFVYIKTIDGGATWSGTTTINVGALEAGEAHGIWFDRWTPGLTGQIIRLGYTSASRVRYRSLNTVGDVLGTERQLTSTGSAQATEVVVGEARNGDLYIGWHSNDANIGNAWRRSTNGGDSWADPGGDDPMENSTDNAIFMPASNTGDDADMWIFFWDDDAPDAISLKEWDFSTTTITETAFGNPTYIGAQIVGVPRHSDGHVFLAAMKTTPRTLELWEINGGGSIVQRTSLVSSGTPFACGITLDQAANRLYVCWSSATNSGVVNYQSSGDGAVTWDGDVQFSSGSHSLRSCHASLSVRAGDTGLFLPIWFDTSPDDFETNPDNAVALGSAGVPAAVTTQQQKLLLL